MKKSQTRVVRYRALEQQRIRMRKEQRKDRILFIGIATFIIALCIICLNLLNKSDMENCIKAGHSSDYCERGF
jgi:hypothetical protein